MHIRKTTPKKSFQLRPKFGDIFRRLAVSVLLMGHVLGWGYAPRGIVEVGEGGQRVFRALEGDEKGGGDISPPRHNAFSYITPPTFFLYEGRICSERHRRKTAFLEADTVK